MLEKLKESFEALKLKLQLISYTMKHKSAFLQVEKQLRGKNTLSGYLHDAEKPLMYLFCFWMSVPEIHKFHRMHNRHHVKCPKPKSREDLVDTIIDWECARLTKPDKPRDAYTTLIELYPEHEATYLPIIQKYLPEQIKKKQEQQKEKTKE